MDRGLLGRGSRAVDADVGGDQLGGVIGADVLVVLDARRSFQTIQLALARADVERAMARAELERAVGGARVVHTVRP